MAINGTYSKRGSMMLKKETTNNAAVIPNVGIPFNDEGMAVEYNPTPASPIAGVTSKNHRAIPNIITAPTGPINMNVEPKTFGHILNGFCGGLTSGLYVPATNIGDLTVGETLTGGTSANTATLVFIGDDYILVSGPSGDLTDGETLTGGTSGNTAVVTKYDSGVYGHRAPLPNDLDDTYTVQFNLKEYAIRYIGVYFHALDALAQSDNVLTAGVQSMGHGQFRHARVTEQLAAGAGGQTVKLDQTYGLVGGDSIKVYRPSTGAYLDFSDEDVKTHTIDTVDNALEITITNLETQLEPEDLIVLAPLTPTYSIDEEFYWIGGGEVSTGPDVDNLSLNTSMKDFNFTLMSEMESEHTARGFKIADRMPRNIDQKGFEATGEFSVRHRNEEFLKAVRNNEYQAIRAAYTAREIGSTGFNYYLRLTYARTQYTGHQTNLTGDDLIEESVPFTAYRGVNEGYDLEILLVNDVASY